MQHQCFLQHGQRVNRATIQHLIQQILLARKAEFTGAFTERLLTYALARGVGARDMPAVRKIVRRAAADDYRVQSIIKGVVESDPFMLRRTPRT